MSARLLVEDGEIVDAKQGEWGQCFERQRGDNWGDRRRGNHERQELFNQKNVSVLTQYQCPQYRASSTPRSQFQRSRSRSHSSTPRTDCRRSSSAIRSDSSDDRRLPQPCRGPGLMQSNGNMRSNEMRIPKSDFSRQGPTHEYLKDISKPGPMVPNSGGPSLTSRWVPAAKVKETTTQPTQPKRVITFTDNNGVQPSPALVEERQGDTTAGDEHKTKSMKKANGQVARDERRTSFIGQGKPVANLDSTIRGWLTLPKKGPLKKRKNLGAQQGNEIGDQQIPKKRKVAEAEHEKPIPKKAEAAKPIIQRKKNISLNSTKGSAHKAQANYGPPRHQISRKEIGNQPLKTTYHQIRQPSRASTVSVVRVAKKQKGDSAKKQKGESAGNHDASGKAHNIPKIVRAKIGKSKILAPKQQTRVVDATPYVVSDDSQTLLDATESSYDTAKSIMVAPFVSESPHSALEKVELDDWLPVCHVKPQKKTRKREDERPQFPPDPTLKEIVDSSSDDSSDSDTDDEEIWQFAEKMFGVTPPGLLKLRRQREHRPAIVESSDKESEEEFCHEDEDDEMRQALTTHRQDILTLPLTETVVRKSKKSSEEKLVKAAAESKRKKEEAKPLTAAQIRAILGEDVNAAPSSHWVRRSSRQPSKAALNAPGVRALLDKLRRNDSDMVVLKMKKYINDPDAPQALINAALDALEENLNCEALYIQNFNMGMHDEQVLHLLKILQLPTCKIWCLNIGETYNVRARTWKKFARGLKRTKVTHMYASEHTIDHELKDRIRNTIRLNRKKHDMHINPENLDVIVQCTHCWWNPMNAKALRPFLRKKGYEHMLHDKEAQGLRGSSSGAPGASELESKTVLRVCS